MGQGGQEGQAAASARQEPDMAMGERWSLGFLDGWRGRRDPHLNSLLSATEVCRSNEKNLEREVEPIEKKTNCA